jgi:hypothetical protein
VAVVEGFIGEEGYAQEAESRHDGEEPEAPVPFCGIENEGCKERAKVRGEDYKSGPDVDFAAIIYQKAGSKVWEEVLRVLMEEEYVFDEHKPTLRKI